MIIYCSIIMKYTSLLLLSVLSVLFVPVIQNAHAQNNPLDQLIGGIKNLTSGAGKALNNTVSQAGQSFQDINRNAASYPGNVTDAGNNNISKNNPIGKVLENTTKGISDTVGKLFNMGNNTAK